MNTRLGRSLGCVALLLIMLAQLAAASPSQSAAFDEGYTITYGYAYLRGGDARLSRGQNPPLTNVFIALPLLLKDDIVFPANDASWLTPDIFGFTDHFMWRANPAPQKIVLLARLPEMMLALVLACVIFAFARAVFDERAATAALFVCAFDPNILAHGHIAGTDLGVTLFMFAAMWQWTLALKHGRLKYALMAGVLSGAALATKYSSVWLIPIAAGVGLIYPGLRRSFGRRLIMGLLVGATALLVIWGTFAFSVGPIEPDGVYVPAPQYWQSLEGVRTRVELSTPAFMLGQISASGFPGYYPFVFLVKTPLPTLIFLTLGVIALIGRRRRADVSVWLPPLLFLLAAMASGLNLGYRLMLPVLPFALVIAGQGAGSLMDLARRVEGRARALKWLPSAAAAVLGLWLAVDVFLINPNHLAYFNQLVDRDRDYEVLVDSNLDWGQDLIALRDWQQARGIDRLNLAYYGSAQPQAYGLDVNLLPGFSLNDYGPEIDGFSAYARPPGWYAVSVSTLQLGLLYSRWNLYAPFKELTPVERVGRSFLIYHIIYPDSGADRAVSLGPPASDLDAVTLGRRPDRQLIVKWAGENAAVIDLQGEARYIARGGEPIFDLAPAVHNAVITRGTRLGNDASGQLRLWTFDARSQIGDALKMPENQPVFTPVGAAIDLPVAFDGGLTLIGYDVSADQALTLITYWRVDRPLTPPLSIFAHAVAADQRLVAQADALNVRVSALEPGDIIIQRLPIGPAAGARSINLGVYDPATLQRKALVLEPTSDHVVVRLR